MNYLLIGFLILLFFMLVYILYKLSDLCNKISAATSQINICMTMVSEILVGALNIEKQKRGD